MSSIKLTPNSSGSGIFSIASPNSNTDRTLTLPDQTGTVLTNAGPFTASASASAGAVTVDASNNVGIGTSSPAFLLDVSKNQNAPTVTRIQNTSTGASSFSILQLQCGGTNYTNMQVSGIGNYFQMASSGVTSAYYDFDTQIWRNNAGTERARIDSSGNLLVGTTSNGGFSATRLHILAPGGGAGGRVQVASNNDWAWFFQNSSGSTVGTISVGASTTSYNTTSDYRLKENVQPMTGALAKVAALKPCTYTWKESGDSGEGFIAHELAEVCPQAVTGEKDAVNEDGSIKPQGIDTSFLVATLTAAIQEQQALINDLTARIAALEAPPNEGTA